MNGFELRSGGKVVSVPMSAKRLLAFLALQERPAHRAYIAGTLWGEVPEDRAFASLRSALWRANRFGFPLVRSVCAQLALDPDVRVDLREAATQARLLIEGAGEADCGPLLAHELLPGWYEDWLLVEREKLRQLRLHALETHAARLTASSRYAEAAEAALTAIACEPLRESAHRALIRVHLAEGNAGEALRHYERFRDQLLAELGLTPSEQLEALVEEAIRR